LKIITPDRECETCGAQAVNSEGSEAWHIERAMDAIIAGDSLRSLCREWSAQGVRVPSRRYRQPDGTRGEPEEHEWAPVALRRTLLRPRNAGLMEARGEIVGKAAQGGVIAGEKQRSTMHYLMDSRLSSAEIVLDRFLARMMHVGVFVHLGLPVMSLLSLFGGVPWEYVVVAYVGTASVTFFAARAMTGVSNDHRLPSRWRRTRATEGPAACRLSERPPSCASRLASLRSVMSIVTPLIRTTRSVALTATAACSFR